MINPSDLAEKLKRLYPKAVCAALSDDIGFFPYRVAVDLKPSPDISEAIRQVQALRDNSKDVIGYGYTVRMQPRRSQTLGENNFPEAILIESMEDLARAVGEHRRWPLLVQAIQTIRARQPSLHAWSVKNWQRVRGIESRVDALLDVVQYLLAHPRPNCFVRELPLAISTKWVSEHESILAQWLDIVLPPSSIDITAPARDFARRYGFRSVHEHLRLRLLDESLRSRLGFPCSELSLPLDTLKKNRIDGTRVIFVENKVNWLTLPSMENTIAFGGLGRGIARLFEVDWLADSPQVYWGDLDTEGFEILAMVRQAWPHIRSILMDRTTLDAFRKLTTTGTGRSPAIPDSLLESEAEAMRRCVEFNQRLEQEHIPQPTVLAAFQAIGWLPTRPSGT